VAGTHGNEINAPWLMDQWQQQPDLIQTHGCEVLSVIGNPEAYAKGCRYLDRDLNRSFQPGLLQQAGLEQISSSNLDREVKRAFDLVSRYGSEGVEPCGLVIDLHSTTASMGNSLVFMGVDLLIWRWRPSSRDVWAYLFISMKPIKPSRAFWLRAGPVAW
jgi:aspartoacylase